MILVNLEQTPTQRRGGRGLVCETLRQKKKEPLATGGFSERGGAGQKGAVLGGKQERKKKGV